MEKLPLPLVCLTAQHVIDDRDAIEGLLREDPAIEKCIPLALKEAFDIPTISDAKTTLEILRIIWRGIHNVLDRDNAYIKAASEGRTYLLPYIDTNPLWSVAWSALTWAVMYGYLDTIKYLIREPLAYFGNGRVNEQSLKQLLHIAIASSRYRSTYESITFIIAVIKNVMPNQLASILNDAYDYTDLLVRTSTEAIPGIHQVYTILNYNGQHREPISTNGVVDS